MCGNQNFLGEAPLSPIRRLWVTNTQIKLIENYERNSESRKTNRSIIIKHIEFGTTPISSDLAAPITGRSVLEYAAVVVAAFVAAVVVVVVVVGTGAHRKRAASGKWSDGKIDEGRPRSCFTTASRGVRSTASSSSAGPSGHHQM